MNWVDSTFGFFGLPLMIVMVGAVLFGYPTFIISFLVWINFYLYTFYRFHPLLELEAQHHISKSSGGKSNGK